MVSREREEGTMSDGASVTDLARAHDFEMIQGRRTAREPGPPRHHEVHEIHEARPPSTSSVASTCRIAPAALLPRRVNSAMRPPVARRWPRRDGHGIRMARLRVAG